MAELIESWIIKMKKWQINQPSQEKVSNILKKTDLTSLCAEVLVSRGMTELDEFVDFFSDGEITDPFLIKDMYEATEYITEAVENGTFICVYGDYDCDGVTATVILYNYLECAGGNVMYYIPEREAGYGLNKEAVRFLSEQGVEMIITVDNGIASVEEADLIDELGMKLIITDHHQPPEILPKALAIIDPHRKDCTSPFKHLAGVGVAMKLIAALDDGNYDTILEQYADIVAIGTIADVVPLVSENRVIVKRGLELLAVTENIGLATIMEKAGIAIEKINSTAIAFMVAPRINAAGRFGSPITAVKALLCEDEEAESLVDELVSLNTERKKVEDKILKEIEKSIKENPQILNEKVLVLCGENWHHGVVGIVCSRVLERYGKPNIIISIEGDEARGSARSIKGFNMYECLSYSNDLLERFGGHECAGGLTLKKENLDAFREKVLEFSNNNVVNMPTLTLSADKLLRAADFRVNIVESLKLLEPFGAENPQPIFAVLGAKVDRIIPLSNGKHTKIELTYDGVKTTALMFGTSTDDILLSQGEYGDFLVFMEINEYNGNKNITLRVKDYRRSGMVQDKYFSAKACYESFMRGEEVSEKLKPRIIPSREDLVEVYKFLQAQKAPQNIDKIFMQLNNDNINFCKLRLCLDIFKEQELLEINVCNDMVTFIPPTKKVDLEGSKILQKLRNL